MLSAQEAMIVIIVSNTILWFYKSMGILNNGVTSGIQSNAGIANHTPRGTLMPSQGFWGAHKNFRVFKNLNV